MAAKKTTTSKTTSKTTNTKTGKGGKTTKSPASAYREPGFFSDYGGYGNIRLIDSPKKPAGGGKK